MTATTFRRADAVRMRGRRGGRGRAARTAVCALLTALCALLALLLSGCGGRGSAGGSADGADGRADLAPADAGGPEGTGAPDAGPAGPDAGGADADGADGADGAPDADTACDEAGERLLAAIVGRPTDRSVAVSVQAAPGAAVALEYGPGCGPYAQRSAAGVAGPAGDPVVLELTGLAPDTRYGYRVWFRQAGETTERPGAAGAFQTARAPGRTFSFGVQGDSHPERLGRMFHPDLYLQNLANAAARRPDFYLLLGDDFSLERLIDNGTLSAANVDAVYRQQREWLAGLGNASAMFLVNGNHEQAAGYLLTEAYPTPFAAAPVLAGSARVRFFPLPAPDTFYGGDAREVAGVGPLRDYYAWQWGDALFVTIDPYWHSPVPVDTGVPGVERVDDEWLITMGDEQYAWLERTLTGSPARWKFVFEHHVLGHGRGGAAIAHQHEWGGYAKSGRTWEFAARRPTWPRPVHRLLAQTGVTVFFFGHDHLYARERVDGLVYQSVPNPADNTYTAFNADAFDPDTLVFPGAVYDPDDGVVLPNSGYLHVTVAPDEVTVAYVRAVLPGDEAAAGAANGDVTFAYTLPAR